MKAFVTAPAGLSRAMTRVATALNIHSPNSVEVMPCTEKSDLIVLHVIGFPETLEVTERLKDAGKKYAIIQYCFKTTQKPTAKDWMPIWKGAELVWSYYNLEKACLDEQILPEANFYHSPLGVDNVFIQRLYSPQYQRPIGVMTSGYVSHPAAEAIEEVAWAASKNNMSVVHLGPKHVVGMKHVPLNWTSIHNITDDKLSEYYSQSSWVSGLRHGEGFELPVLEGLVCGARPLVFDRPDMTQWFEDYAVKVPEYSDDVLIEELANIFKYQPKPVSIQERQEIINNFSWRPIAEEFWRRLSEA